MVFPHPPPQMHPDHSEMRDLASRICRDYLHGAWKDVTSQTIGFKHISGGLSNLLYLISLPDHLVDADKYRGERKRCSSESTAKRTASALESLITESVIFTLLSGAVSAPNSTASSRRPHRAVHNARPLLTSELADRRLSAQIAQKMAAIHGMEVPLHKEPGWLWETIDRWLKSSEKCIEKGNVPDFAKSLLDIEFKQEAEWLKRRILEEKCPVAFCHNDMQEGNILVSEEDAENNYGDPKIVLIDFEYCSYNYRSFDIANHFIEWVYDYTETNHPFFKEKWENYPSEQQRLEFVRTYLKEMGSKENPKKVLREVKVFSLASHFFWALWSIVNANTSQIPFGYWEYAVARLNAYIRFKNELVNTRAAARP